MHVALGADTSQTAAHESSVVAHIRLLSGSGMVDETPVADALDHGAKIAH